MNTNAKYFNKWEFEQAVSLISDDPFEAKNKFEEYIKQYPEDYLIYPYYASVLITLRDFKHAEEILDYVEKASKNDSKYLSYEDKVKLLNYNIYISRIRLLSFQDKYNELYHLSLTSSQYGNNVVFDFLKIYCMKKLYIPVEYEKNNNSYLYSQIYNYSYDRFLEHIKTHIAECNEKDENPSIGSFVVGFPIEKVIEEVKKYFHSDKCLFNSLYDDLYIFKYNECGRVSGKMVNYFKVVCFHNTDYIITLYPALDCEYLPCIDLNYLVDKKDDFDNCKVKRLSQIDKFNKRYGNN